MAPDEETGSRKGDEDGQAGRAFPISRKLVKAAIDEVNPGRYNRSGKSDRIKGLGKEG